MPRDFRPYLGSTQPSTGSSLPVAFGNMGRKSKKDRPPAIIQAVLADNLLRLRDLKFGHLTTATARNKALAVQAGTALSQVQRILDQKLACGVDMLEQLAAVLEVSPCDLITPYFARSHVSESRSSAENPKNPSPSRITTS